MKTFNFWGLVFLGLIVLIPPVAHATAFEAAIGMWRQDPKGDVAYNNQSLGLQNDPKYGDRSRPFGRIKIKMPVVIPNIYLMATPMKADGRGSTTVTLGGKTYNVGAFTSEVKLDHYDIGLYYGLPCVKKATRDRLNIEIGLNLRLIDLEAEITRTATSTQVSKKVTLPVPMVYLGLQIKPVEALSVEGEFRGVAYDGNHHYDLIGRAKYKFLKPAFLGVGYRYEDLEIDESDVKARVRLGGPFMELGFEF